MNVKCPHDELVAIKKLKPNPRNPNKHDAAQIVRLGMLLEYYGWRKPLIVSNQSGFIVTGHGTLLAAKHNGWTKVPVSRQDFDNEEQEYGYLVADNSASDWSELDLSSINAEVPELGPDFDLDLLGIKDFVLDPSEKEDEKADEVPEPPKEAKSKRGDLWVLGNHRVMCGDSTCQADVAALMGGEKADMVFTDPPYGVNAVSVTGSTGGGKAFGKTSGRGKTPLNFGSTRGKGFPGIVKANLYSPIIGDDNPFDAKPFLSLAPVSLLWGANYYSDTLPVGWRWVVWDKKAEKQDGSFSDTFSDCELAWTNAPGRRVTIYRHLWSGLCRKGNRSEELKGRVHPTQKPVGMCAEVLCDFSKENNLILDLFLGSGSTLIACEKTNRKCYGMEIDPVYIDVILSRWAKYTDKDPVRSDGVKWSDLSKNNDA